jgi:histidinol-phosphate/aromatic aminotransferase/cobyric acid decarboxylase-like protein
MAPEPRRELLALRPATHGGAAEPGQLDFSTGISPFAPPPEILEAARDADPTRYPHATALPFRDAVAALHDLDADRVVGGAGSVELIWALARAFAGPGRKGLVVTPAFGEYEQALRASGADVVTVRMTAPAFVLSMAALDIALADHAPAIAFVCRPSNPCLTRAPADELAALARRWPDTLFVVDEAYQPLFEPPFGEDARLTPATNVAILRSMTKVFALAGPRLGYLLASSDVARAVQSVLPPWNVSSAAQAAGIVAARLLPTHAGPIRARVATVRASLAEALSPVAGRPAHGGGTFLLYDVGDADALCARLRARGVAVRSCASFSLPAHVRVGVRLEPDHAALARAWRAAEGA